MDIKRDYNEYFYEPFCDVIDEDSYWSEYVSHAFPYDLSDVKNVYNWILHAARTIAMNETTEQEWNREALGRILDRVYNALLAKNADYGGSAFRAPCFAPGMPVDAAIRVRMSDKWNRYDNLLDKDRAEVSDETLFDTLYDFIGYGILLCMLMNSGTEEAAQNVSLPDGAILVYYPSGMPLSELRDRVSSCDVQIIPIQ